MELRYIIYLSLFLDVEKLIILKNSLHKLRVCDNLSSLYILIMILNFVYSHVDEIYFP